jgi:hypothetical protein
LHIYEICRIDTSIVTGKIGYFQGPEEKAHGEKVLNGSETLFGVIGILITK